MTQPRVVSMKQCADRLVNFTEPSEKYAYIPLLSLPSLGQKIKNKSSYHRSMSSSIILWQLKFKIFHSNNNIINVIERNGFECTFHSAAVRHLSCQTAPSN